MHRFKSNSEDFLIRAARWPDDEAIARLLLHDYGRYLANTTAKICISGYEEELASLSQRWSSPESSLLLAFLERRAVGCIAVKCRDDLPRHYEVKRLWVEDAFRGRGVGRALVESAIEWTRGQGASCVLLDTHPSVMPQAFSLYRSLGFQQRERHNDNAVPDIVFMQRMLQ